MHCLTNELSCLIYPPRVYLCYRGAHLFAPEDRGICDVLLANGKIIAVGADIPRRYRTGRCAVINLSGRMLIARALLGNTFI